MTRNQLSLSWAEQCVLREVQGFTPQMGQLVHMLEYVRQNTMKEVKTLTIAQLDTLVFPDGNPIGMLLAHIAGIEAGYQRLTFWGERPEGKNPEYQLGQLGLLTFHDLPAEHYLAKLGEVRDITLNELRHRDDAWLQITSQPWGNRDWNNHFAWFHLLEDELRHQGQIVSLKKEILRREATS